MTTDVNGYPLEVIESDTERLLDRQYAIVDDLIQLQIKHNASYDDMLQVFQRWHEEDTLETQVRILNQRRARRGLPEYSINTIVASE